MAPRATLRVRTDTRDGVGVGIKTSRKVSGESTSADYLKIKKQRIGVRKSETELQ